ncbi:MAG: calcium-binding protein [Candidatus Methylumidiphilus sp.]
MATSDAERDERIANDILVDCYDEDEESMGWYYYLDETLNFPFTARCIKKRAVSPLKVGDEAQVVAMAPEEECEHGEMFVFIQQGKKKLAVPLAQLQPLEADEKTIEAVGDWHYWKH